jgi:poly(ADP-ribose) polymerase-like protein
MPHVFEPASSGRSKCRGCGVAIAKGELRFGERIPNPFGDGEATLWYHPPCAAYKRPESMLEALSQSAEIADRAELDRIAQASMTQRRLSRVDGAERAASGQASCRQCKEKIEKGAWRIRLVFFEEGMFSPGGYLHLACRGPYFEDHDIVRPLLHFSPALNEADREELRRELAPG